MLAVNTRRFLFNCISFFVQKLWAGSLSSRPEIQRYSSDRQLERHFYSHCNWLKVIRLKKVSALATRQVFLSFGTAVTTLATTPSNLPWWSSNFLSSSSSLRTSKHCGLPIKEALETDLGRCSLYLLNTTTEKQLTSNWSCIMQFGQACNRVREGKTKFCPLWLVVLSSRKPKGLCRVL